MVHLKLMHMPQGTNRNRTLRRAPDGREDDLDLAEVEELFRRFWRTWYCRLSPERVPAQLRRGSGGGGT